MLKQEEYFITVNRPYPPFLASLILKGSSEEKYFLPFFKKPSPVKNIVIVEGNWFYSIDEINNAGDIAVREWNSSDKIEKAWVLYEKLEKDFIESTHKSFEKFVQAFEAYMPSMHPVYASDKLVFNKLKTLLNAKVGEERSSKILDSLNIPLRNNYFKQEEYDLLHAKNLKEHVKRFEWLISRYGQNKPYTVAHAKKKLKQMNKSEYLRNWYKEKKEVAKKIKEAKMILGPKYAFLADYMQFIVYYRTQRTDVINKCAYLAIPMLTKFAKRKGLTYEQLMQISQVEILGNKIPPKQEIAERMKEGATVMEDGKITIQSGARLVKYKTGSQLTRLKTFFKEKIGNSSQFKGEIACKGYAKGKVVLLISGQNLSKVKKGDIIVTSMTTPDMVPAMKKAAAFVTDEGGITCHAAIVSREMKKPCVIGTKFATKVFKDGDLVEVDANRGIVRIIK